ncbi:toprim domain-containing protein [Novosphingobium sp. PP1Y]|uniref:DUF7146 domain-containing protein n=1 Tax=Novosphingobium sp. PP1Y TaxID=702113 RepID=UPI00020EE5BF|nr:toprim domain-containing protein [Novosphingobium sp. PP1Y]CCA89811.1 conserved hypothetical protein [Novosphingobium sp. PP1Y]
MIETAHDLARALADRAELVCRHYLSHGTRQGNYWQVGDVRNTAGRSMYVRLSDTAKGVAGKWTDAATGEHGDLLDIIRETCGLADFRDVTDEARRFLRLPLAEPQASPRRQARSNASFGKRNAARRLFAMGVPIEGTLAQSYLQGRGIASPIQAEALRFHPHCYYRTDDACPTEHWPAMLAAVTEQNGKITGVHRTWLDPDGFNEETLGKAPVATSRRALGDLLGNAVRFGKAGPVMAAGEGIETVLSLRCALPTMPMLAALSAAHLAAIAFPASLRRLYVAQDVDPAGEAVLAALMDRGEQAGIEVIALPPALDDFNDDLRHLGIDAIRERLRVPMAAQDAALFLAPCA